MFVCASGVAHHTGTLFKHLHGERAKLFGARVELELQRLFSGLGALHDGARGVRRGVVQQSVRRREERGAQSRNLIQTTTDNGGQLKVCRSVN